MSLCYSNERGGEMRVEFDAVNFFKKQKVLWKKGKIYICH
jgi:hypothetical protein